MSKVKAENPKTGENVVKSEAKIDMIQQPAQQQGQATPQNEAEKNGVVENVVKSDAKTLQNQDAVENVVKSEPDLLSKQTQLYTNINTILTLSKYLNGIRQITTEIGRIYVEPMLKLSKHVYDSFIESNGSEQMLESLLKGLPKPVEKTVELQNQTQKTVETPPSALLNQLQNQEKSP